MKMTESQLRKVVRTLLIETEGDWDTPPEHLRPQQGPLSEIEQLIEMSPGNSRDEIVELIQDSGILQHYGEPLHKAYVYIQALEDQGAIEDTGGIISYIPKGRG